MDDQALSTLQRPFSPDEVAAFSEHDHIGAIFADRDHAAAAVEELRALPVRIAAPVQGTRSGRR